MSRYTLRGTLEMGDEPDPYRDDQFSSDMRWEYGFDPAEGVFFAEFYDEIEEGDWFDDEWIVFVDPAVPVRTCWAPTVQDLQRDMGIALPDHVVAALVAEEDQHLAQLSLGHRATVATSGMLPPAIGAKPASALPAPGQLPKTKIGRNDPCWCGSGRKYKRCCLGRRPDTEPPPRDLP